jgi:hypothetical protein
LVIDAVAVPVAPVGWKGARRIIRNLFPPIDLFEDIADPEDWPLLIAAEQKTNPQLRESLGVLDLVPPACRVAGPGATHLMAPFTHVSPDRPSRFSGDDYGVFYVARRFETALLETMHHHARFMARTAEPPGWTSQFRELVLDIAASLHDLRGGDPALAPALRSDDYAEAQTLAAALRTHGADGIVYPSPRDPGGECAGLFYPDRATHVVQGRPLDYHWNGASVDVYRDAGSGEIFRVS